MKFDIHRKEFFEAVTAAVAASSARTSVSILQHIKIEASESGIRVIGCDGEMWAERTVPCMVSETGAVCVQARLMHELVSSMAEADISLTTLDRQGILMTQGASEYRMLTADAADFPEPPPIVGEGELNLPMGVLRSGVDSVLYAVSAENHRLVLSGVLFLYDGNVLTLVATDTHRLAVRKIHQPGVGTSMHAVVPEKALKSIKALPVSDDHQVQIRFSEDRIGVETSGAKVVSQLLAGTYPNWERVVPSECTRWWSVESDQLLEKVKRTMILARDNAYRVKFKGADDQIVISARSDEKGEAKEEVPMVGNNPLVEIAFNGKYVQEALSPITGPGVRIEMTESARPAVFRPADDESGYFCVIMPMALS